MNTARLHYHISPKPQQHLFHVHLRITGTHPAGLTVFLPNWIAGSYMIRDFARHIVTIRAFDEAGQAIALTPLNQHSWQSAGFSQALNLEYEVFAHDPSVRTAFLNTDTGFFNATSLCLTVADYADQPHALTLHAPADCAHWQVATQLSRAATTAERAFGAYFAANYDELADRPVRMGALQWLEFTAHGVAHTLAISGAVPHLNSAQLIADAQAICAEQLRLFEPDVAQTGQAPFDSYLFLIDVRGSGYGGLEHRDSTALLCVRDSLPTLADNDTTRRAAYLDFLGLLSHEYFHSWNVKRIKPAEFVDYDLSVATDTSLLWFFEGVTNYYDDLILHRVGILSERQYRDILNRNIDSVLRQHAATRQTVTEAGFYAWTKYYQPTENTLNANVNYYVQGALIALCLDLFIRNHSQDTFSLDDVMRALWHDFGREFYQTSEPRGVRLADIQNAIERFAGTSAEELLKCALFSTEPLPLASLLLGQKLQLVETPPSHAELGASLRKTAEGWLVERVGSESIAEQAGLAPQDILIALNRLKLEQKPDDLFPCYPAEAALSLSFWRDGRLVETTLFNRIHSGQKGHFRIEDNTETSSSATWPKALSAQ